MNRTKNRSPTHDPREVVIVSGGIKTDDYHKDEGGPSAWRVCSAENQTHATHVLSWAVFLAARSPKDRYILASSEPVEVFVISDASLTDDDRRIASSIASINVGTYTEAHKLAKEARWLQLPSWATSDQIAKLATLEVQALRSEKPEVFPHDVIIMVWKRNPESFGGTPMMEIGQKICDAIFTCGCENIPAFMPGESEDGEGK